MGILINPVEYSDADKEDDYFVAGWVYSHPGFGNPNLLCECKICSDVLKGIKSTDDIQECEPVF